MLSSTISIESSSLLWTDILRPLANFGFVSDERNIDAKDDLREVEVVRSVNFSYGRSHEPFGIGTSIDGELRLWFNYLILGREIELGIEGLGLEGGALA